MSIFYIALAAFGLLTAVIYSVGLAIAILVIAVALYLSEERGWS